MSGGTGPRDDAVARSEELAAEIERLRRKPGIDSQVMRALFSVSGVPAFLVGGGGAVLAANSAAEARLDVGPGGAAGMDLAGVAEQFGGYELMPVADLDGLILRLAVFRGEGDLDGALTGWLGQKARLLAVFLEHSRESCLLLDRDCRVLASNPAAAKRLGLSQNELTMRDMCEIIPSDVAARRREHVESVFREGRVVRFEDGRDGLILSHTLIPVRGQTGEIEAVAAIARDVTEERRAEEAMAVSFQERDNYRIELEALFRAIPDTIVTVDPNLRIRDVNRDPGEVCALLPNAGPGSMFTGCAEGCLGALTETLATGKKVVEYRVDCPAMPGRVVILNTAPLSLGDAAAPGKAGGAGKTSGALLIVRDVTKLAKLESSLSERSRFGAMAGQSPAMMRVFDLLERLAGLPTTVLILGESGTGKDLAAEALHRGGQRARGPLVKVNCSALSETLLESELFGHVKGAFTGADRDKEGRFQAAEGGTVFLDEIGEISPTIQLKLLRFLESKEFEPVGSSRTLRADVRVVAATNADLASKVAAGQFRADLYFRLRVMVVTMPALRERPEDVALLTQVFLSEFGQAMHKNFTAPSREAMDILLRHPWPGNVRELRHALEHACILSPGGAIAAEHLPVELGGHKAAPEMHHGAGRVRTDREAVAEALRRAGGNKSKAARYLGVDRRTVYRKIEEYGLPPD